MSKLAACCKPDHDTLQRAAMYSTRRQFLQTSAAGLAATQLVTPWACAEDSAGGLQGYILGQSQGAAVGQRILANGGNAADAAVAAALVAGVVALPMCGIGGYGGHAVIARPDGATAAIDFNSTAPAAASEDMYPLDAHDKVIGGVNSHGWLAAGVPGTLAGLQLVLDRFGTRKLDAVIEPAVRFARDGFMVDAALAKQFANVASHFARDPGSAQTFLPAGKPPAEGATFRNPRLAALLDRLAKANRVEDFYRGEAARQIARAFADQGGFLTDRDLADYQAREVRPISLEWRGRTIHTAPLTAGGLSIVQVLTTLRALEWDKSDPADPASAHARIEAMRLAWHDRLTLLGDPQGTSVPWERLLSSAHAEQSAERVRLAVRNRTIIAAATDGRSAGGTIHLTAVDPAGMMVALTLTHGEGFGARVTVGELGLLLGHGMSRFEPTPGHPNAPRPGRRPLNNMCPTIVTQDGLPIVALGATGGRRIPNTLIDVLSGLIGRDLPLSAAASTPRLHTEGGATLGLAKGWNDEQQSYLAQVGYKITAGGGANLNGIARDPRTGSLVLVP